MNLATLIVLLLVVGLVGLAVVALCRGKSVGSCCDGKKKNTGGDCASCNIDCPFKRR